MAPVSRGAGAAPPECYSSSPGARRASSQGGSLAFPNRCSAPRHPPPPQARIDSQGHWRPLSLRPGRRRGAEEKRGTCRETRAGGGRAPSTGLPGSSCPLLAERRIYTCGHRGLARVASASPSLWSRASASGEAVREAAGRGSTRGADFGEEALERKTEVPHIKRGWITCTVHVGKEGVSTPAPPLSLMNGQSGDSVERAAGEGWPGAQISP